MKNTESLRKLLHAMSDFNTVYRSLNHIMWEYEVETGESINDIPGFVDNYPFDKSFDDLNVSEWVTSTIESVRKSIFKVLNYEYLNTGGNCMVGIFEVWLPAEMKTVYAYTNEEGCTLSLVDYIRNDVEVGDFDEVTLDCIDWGRATGHEKYFELYRHCLNEYTKSDCKHFGYVRSLAYHLLSDDLQSLVDTDYRDWCEENNGGVIETDGVCIIVSPAYDVSTDTDRQLQDIKDFIAFHDTTAGDKDFYNEEYVITFAGKTIRLPFMADVWDAMDNLLRVTVQEW